jgi:hypothetical protein
LKRKQQLARQSKRQEGETGFSASKPVPVPEKKSFLDQLMDELQPTNSAVVEPPYQAVALETDAYMDIEERPESIEAYSSKASIVESNSPLSEEYFKHKNKDLNKSNQPEHNPEIEMFRDETDGYFNDFSLKKAVIYRAILDRPYE